ncbi:MAG: ABC transporter ATP-binding protein [Acidobacteria bacterium]|nr:ABC transporter ATP-binding protein [Acidobacteriota bacterium]
MSTSSAPRALRQSASSNDEVSIAPAALESSDLVLEVKDFSVDYGWGERAVRAVRNVDLDVHRSQVLGIAGESGSGKSTLVYAVTRLLRSPAVISGGDARLFLDADKNTGSDVRTVDLMRASERELRSIRWSQISIVLQSALNALNPVLRISAEFDEVLKTHRRDMNRHQRRARAVELLELVGLNEDRLARFPHELSGGQRQRIMIALALALDPQLVIMDEPTTALDVVTQREIISELRDLRARFGFAMVFITHDLALLVEIADEIAVMYAGTIVERAPAASLHDAPRHPYTLGLLNSSPPLHGKHHELVGIPGSPPDLAQSLVGCSFRARCPFALERCASETPPLVAIEDGGRMVACWLHDGSATNLPEALRREVSLSKRAAPQPRATKEVGS